MEKNNRIHAVAFEYHFVNLSRPLDKSGRPSDSTVYRNPATETLPSFLTDYVVQMSKSFTESHQAIQQNL